MYETESQLSQLETFSEFKEGTSAFAITKDDVTVVLPVPNVEEGISVVIDELRENGYRNILVVDGYSTDLTVQAARQKGVPVIEQHESGKTRAIRTAINHVSTLYGAR
jgi:dolichol-phosphate mannosyltransferase